MACPRKSCAQQPRPRLSTDADIRREVAGSKGRYVLVVDGHEAELTYSILSPSMIIADHTGVPDALRGTGAGARLVTRLVEDARAEGVKIVPLCPFVNSQRAKHPEWADHLTRYFETELQPTNQTRELPTLSARLARFAGASGIRQKIACREVRPRGRRERRT